MDVMLLPKTMRGNTAVLIAVDQFSKWMSVVPLKNKTGATVSRALNSHILPSLPKIPFKVLTDNGKEFKCKEFNGVLKSFNIRHKYSTPYHPSSNGGVERTNRTVIQLLKGLIEREVTSWDLKIHTAVLIYNNKNSL